MRILVRKLLMKIYAILIGLIIFGCASQPAELTEEERNIHVFYEEPKVDYESLGRIDTTSSGEHAMDVLEKVIRHAAELGADGVMVHSILNKGTVAGGSDMYGTGGGGGTAVFQIQATAIRYVE